MTMSQRLIRTLFKKNIIEYGIDIPWKEWRNNVKGFERKGSENMEEGNEGHKRLGLCFQSGSGPRMTVNLRW